MLLAINCAISFVKYVLTAQTPRKLTRTLLLPFAIAVSLVLATQMALQVLTLLYTTTGRAYRAGDPEQQQPEPSGSATATATSDAEAMCEIGSSCAISADVRNRYLCFRLYSRVALLLALLSCSFRLVLTSCRGRTTCCSWARTR